MDKSISDSPITTRIPSTGRQSTINRMKDVPMNQRSDNHDILNPFVIRVYKRFASIRS